MPADLDGCDFDGSGKVTADDGQALLDYVTGVRTRSAARAVRIWIRTETSIPMMLPVLLPPEQCCRDGACKRKDSRHDSCKGPWSGQLRRKERRCRRLCRGLCICQRGKQQRGCRRDQPFYPGAGLLRKLDRCSMFDVGSFIQYHYGMETRLPTCSLQFSRQHSSSR